MVDVFRLYSSAFRGCAYLPGSRIFVLLCCVDRLIQENTQIWNGTTAAVPYVGVGVIRNKPFSNNANPGDAWQTLHTHPRLSRRFVCASFVCVCQGSISSDLEKTLIKATRPDNDPAKRKHVNLLLQAAEHAFPVYMNPKVCETPAGSTSYTYNRRDYCSARSNDKTLLLYCTTSYSLTHALQTDLFGPFVQNAW